MILNRQANEIVSKLSEKKRAQVEKWGLLGVFSCSRFVETTDFSPPPHNSLHFFLMVNCKFRVPGVLSAVYTISSSSKEHCSLACLVIGLFGDPGHVEVRTFLPSTSKKCKKWSKPLCAKLFANFQITRLHV